jgi:transaldolase
VRALAGVDVHTAPPKAFVQYLNSDLDPTTVRPYESILLPVDTDLDCAVLWSVSPEFEAFARAAGGQGADVRTPGDLVELARSHGINDLFREWTPDERAEIRADGKIPVLEKWLPGATLDDLMTRAALESFTADQATLDDRIRGLAC